MKNAEVFIVLVVTVILAGLMGYFMPKDSWFREECPACAEQKMSPAVQDLVNDCFNRQLPALPTAGGWVRCGDEKVEWSLAAPFESSVQEEREAELNAKRLNLCRVLGGVWSTSSTEMQCAIPSREAQSARIERCEAVGGRFKSVLVDETVLCDITRVKE